MLQLAPRGEIAVPMAKLEDPYAAGCQDAPSTSRNGATLSSQMCDLGSCKKAASS